MDESVSVDLSADLGEDMPFDEQIMPHLSSVNIGNSHYTGVTWATRIAVELALHYNVTIGAHVSYPDVLNFGRKSMEMSDLDLSVSLFYQNSSFDYHLMKLGSTKKVKYIKPHGALYHDTLNKPSVRDTVLSVSRLSKLPLLLQAGFTDQLRTGHNMPIYDEGFADRRYTSDGRLVPRSQPGAVLAKAEEIAQQAVAIALGTPIDTVDGGKLQLKVDTVCIHGDSEAAVEGIIAIREAFTKARIAVNPFLK